MPKTPFNFKIGADPEFILLAGDKFLGAQGALTRFIGKVQGIKITEGDRGWNIGKHGNIGYDGASMIGEMRPTAENTPAGVVEHIGALLSVASKAMPFADISALSFVNPAGGHIHLEVPEGMSVETAKRRAKMVCALAAPILAAEHPISSKYRRDNNRYGTLDDLKVEEHFRRQTEQGIRPGYTAEIRFPTAEWLITPKIAEATLAYVAVIWDGLINSESFRKEARGLCFANNKESIAITTMFSSTYGDVGVFITSKIRRLIRTAPKYAEYKDLVEYALNTKQILADKEKAGWLINVGWKFAKSPTQPTKRQFLSEKIVRERLTGKDDETLGQYWPVAFNDDLNVAVFSEALSERVAAFGWKPEREYFLFGLKQGIETIIAKDKSGFYSGAEYGETLTTTLEKMSNKAAELGQQNGKKIDVRNGKVKTIQDPVIIGIPRTMREKKDTKDFLRMVIDIDTKKITSNPIVRGKEAIIIPDTETETGATEITRNNLNDIAIAVERIQTEILAMEGRERQPLSIRQIPEILSWRDHNGYFRIVLSQNINNRFIEIWNRNHPEFLAENGDMFCIIPGLETVGVVNLGNEDDQATQILEEIFGVNVPMLSDILMNYNRVTLTDTVSLGNYQGDEIGINPQEVRIENINTIFQI